MGGALEVGKSATASPRRAELRLSCPWRSRLRFPRSLRRRAQLDVPEPCASRDGRQHGEQDQGARARPALEACANRPDHAVNMLTEERLCERHPGAAPYGT